MLWLRWNGQRCQQLHFPGPLDVLDVAFQTEGVLVIVGDVPLARGAYRNFKRFLSGLYFGAQIVQFK